MEAYGRPDGFSLKKIERYDMLIYMFWVKKRVNVMREDTYGKVRM